MSHHGWALPMIVVIQIVKIKIRVKR